MFRLRVAGLEGARRLISRSDGASLLSVRPESRTSLATISRMFTTSSSEIINEEMPHPAPTRFAVVEHGDVYMEEMGGGHGRQLSLAYQESSRGEDKYLPDDLLDQYATSLDEVIARSSSPLSEPAEQGESDIDREAEAEEMDGADDEEEDEGEEFDEESVLEQYNNDGTPMISREDRIAYKAGAPSGGNFAIINLNGSQHKVTVDDVVVVDKLKPVSKWKVGETITLDSTELLLLGSSERTLVGLPGVTGASVKIMVEEITRDATTITFKKRRKKHSQRKRGSRREVTMLRVVEVEMPQEFQQVLDHREQLVG